MAESIAIKPKIGILAIQGAVKEHVEAISISGAETIEIRQAHQITADLDGIILPGGESTTMAIVGERWGLFPLLKEWVQLGKPIWGTCAGMILLSDHAIKQQNGGQSLVGGLDVHVCRNYFGSQIHSRSLTLQLPEEMMSISANSNTTTITAAEKSNCDAVFIRAPAILTIGPAVKTLATIRAAPCKAAHDEVYRLLFGDSVEKEDDASISRKRARMEGTDEPEEEKLEVRVAVRQGNILATAFHPELTSDRRWHRYFLTIVNEWKVAQHQNMDQSS